MHLRHLNSTPKSFFYSITIYDITSLDTLLSPPAAADLPQPPFRPLDPFILTISSRSKRNQTRIALLQHSAITFDEQITFHSTLFQRPAAKPASRGGGGGQQRFDKKLFTFALVNLRLQNDKTKRFTVHSTAIDLAQFASTDEETESSQSFILQAEKGVEAVKGPELRLTIQCKCVGDGAPSEASLLSVMGRTSRSRSTSHIRTVEDSKQRRWRERKDEKQEEEEVDMRRKEREEEGKTVVEALTSPSEYRVKLDMISDDDAEDRQQMKRGRRRRKEEERVEEEREAEADDRRREEEAMEREQQIRNRKEKRRTFDAEQIFHPPSPSLTSSTSTSSSSSIKPIRAVNQHAGEAPLTPPPSVSLSDILPTLRSTSTSSLDRVAYKPSSSSLFDQSSPSQLASLQSSAYPSTHRAAASRNRLLNEHDARDMNEVKRPSQPPPSTLSSTSSAVSPAPLAFHRPPIPAIHVNIHIPPHLDRAERDEHERRYRQRLEPRLAFVLSALFPSSLFTSSAYVTSVSSLSTLPTSPCIFFSSFITLRQQQEFELEQRENDEESRSRALEQYQYNQMTDKQKAQWKKNRDTHSQHELDRLNTLSASRQQRRQREEADNVQRVVEQAAMADEMRRVGEEWYRHGYSVSGVGMWRLVSLCEMCCVDEEIEVEVKRREDGEERAESGKKRKGKVKRKEHETVRTQIAHRAWMLEMVLRLLRRRVEESRDHYGELLWHINALLILQRCLRRRKEKVESVPDDDQYATLLISVKDFGLALPVNGKAASRPASGTATPAEVSSGSSSFLPYYPFIASASSFPFASLDYSRSAISSSLSPLGFLLHHTTSFLRSLFSLLFHHLSFAVSYRLPLSSILSPSSFSLETVLDFLTDVQSFLVLSQLQPHLRLCVVQWLLEAIGVRVVNAVMYEVKRVDGGGTDEQEQDAYELALAPPIIQRMTSQPLPSSSAPSTNTSAAASAAFSASHPQLPAIQSEQLLADASSFLSLGMRLMMIYTALRDWMHREHYTADERDELSDALLPLHSLAMFGLIEKDNGREWRRECGGLNDEQLTALCRVYEKVGGEKVGDGWMKKGKSKGKRSVADSEGDVFVELPAVVEVNLDWNVVPFAAQSVLLPRALRDASPSSVVDGLLDADALIIM